MHAAPEMSAMPTIGLSAREMATITTGAAESHVTRIETAAGWSKPEESPSSVWARADWFRVGGFKRD